jgi:Leucine-rich repeat (LRR) protein
MLDISNNQLREIPHNIHELNNLSVLNISGNLGAVLLELFVSLSLTLLNRALFLYRDEIALKVLMPLI